MPCDLSIILPLRDLEMHVAAMVRCAVRIAEAVEQQRPASSDVQGTFAFEILALDERSGDNTLSILSVLHSQIPALRTLQDLDAGSAIARASRVARGRTWLLFDHPIETDVALWALEQVHAGEKRAALVPGELLAVDRELGQAALGGRRGGLVIAQECVQRHLRRQGHMPAELPTPVRNARQKAGYLVRRSLAKLGFSRFDRRR